MLTIPANTSIPITGSGAARGPSGTFSVTAQVVSADTVCTPDIQIQVGTNTWPFGFTHPTITVKALPVVSISGGPPVTEGGQATFTVTASPTPASALTVNLTVAQTGAFVAAGLLGPTTVTVPTSGSVTYTVATEGDSTNEANGSVTVTLNAGTGYNVHGTQGSGSVTVNDDDASQPPPRQLPASPAQGSPDLVSSFGGATVAELTLVSNETMEPVVLPEASGGNGALNYSLTSAPAGLAGLTFDPATRRLSGTPDRAGSWTFTYRVDDADANRADSDAAILTFMVQVQAPALVRAPEAEKKTLAGVAMRTLTSALGHIGARFSDIAPSGDLTLAGQQVNLAMLAEGGYVGHGTCPSGESGRHGFDRHGLANAFGRGSPEAGADCAGWSRTVWTDELLNTSAFSLALGVAEGSGGTDPSVPLWSVWGRGDYATFAGRPEEIRYDGKARSGWLGIDARVGRWVAGMALSHGVSETDYRYEDSDATVESGRLETTLTALYPYGRWTIGEGLELRGVLGAGTGEVRHTLEDGERETGDLEMRMASAGVRHTLPPVAGIDLAMRADAGVVRMEIDDGPEVIAGVSADSWRVRLGLEASRHFALDNKVALTPFVEAVGRRDGGDGLVGSGLEVAGGVRYSAPRVEVELRGRILVAHAEEGAREQGVSVTARVGPGTHGRGLSLSLSPRWGVTTGGAQALWRDEISRPFATGAVNEAAMDARIGYGFAMAERGVLTPFAETRFAGEESRRLRLGTRFDASYMDLGVELSGERRESGAVDPEHVLRFDLMLRF